MFKVGELVTLALNFPEYSAWKGTIGLILKSFSGKDMRARKKYLVCWWLADGSTENFTEAEVDLKHV